MPLTTQLYSPKANMSIQIKYKNHLLHSLLSLNAFNTTHLASLCACLAPFPSKKHSACLLCYSVCRPRRPLVTQHNCQGGTRIGLSYLPDGRRTEPHGTSATAASRLRIDTQRAPSAHFKTDTYKIKKRGKCEYIMKHTIERRRRKYNSWRVGNDCLTRNNNGEYG